MNQKLFQKLKEGFEKDPELLIDRSNLEKTLGNDLNYLKDILGFTKSDLIRLSRLNLAIKARYATENKRKRNTIMPDGTKVPITGPHRVRWIIFKEALE